MTLYVGTKVKWGGIEGSHFDGTIRGLSDWGGKTYYVIEDGDNGKLYPRPEEWVTEIPETTLPEYVAAYIKHELDCRHFDRPISSDLNTWVANAFEAYEEGAR